MIQKTLKYVVITLLFAVVLTPFIVSYDMFFPYITGKNFYFRFLVEILAALWIVWAFWDSRVRPRLSWPVISMTVFVAVLFVADLLGVNPYLSLWSGYERMEGFVCLFHIWLFFMVLISVMQTEKLWSAFLRVFTFAPVLAFVWKFFEYQQRVSALVKTYGIENLEKIKAQQSLSQYLGMTDSARWDFTLGNPIYLAVLMLFVIVFAALLLYRDYIKNWSTSLSVGRHLRALSYVVLIGLYTFVLIKSGTRGAWVGMAGGALVAALSILAFERAKFWRVASMTVIGLVVICTATLYIARDTAVVQNQRTLARMATIFEFSQASSQVRTIVWGMAFEGFKERPILGWGQENFQPVFNKYYDPRMHSQEAWFDRVHNAPLDFLIAAGLLGFLAYLSLFVSAVVVLYRRLRAEESVLEDSLLLGLLGAYFVHSLFVFDNVVSYILFAILLAYIHFRSGTDHFLAKWNEKWLTRKYSDDAVAYVIAPLVIVVLAFAVYFVNIPGYRANKAVLSALAERQDIMKAFASFEEALDYKSFGNAEIREQLVSFSNNVMQGEYPTEFKNMVFTRAAAEMDQQLTRDPLGAKAEYAAMTLYQAKGDTANFLAHATRAHELSPNKQFFAMTLAKFYLSVGEAEQAVTLMQKTYESERQFTAARLLYAVALIHADRLNDAQAVLMAQTYTDPYTGRDITIPDVSTTEDILSTLLRLGRVTDLVKTVRAYVTAYPNDIDGWMKLVSMYMTTGQKSLAVSTLYEAAKVNPEINTELKSIVDQIWAYQPPAGTF